MGFGVQTLAMPFFTIGKMWTPNPTPPTPHFPPDSNPNHWAPHHWLAPSS